MFFVGETCFWGKCRLLRCFNLIFVYYFFFLGWIAGFVMWVCFSIFVFWGSLVYFEGYNEDEYVGSDFTGGSLLFSPFFLLLFFLC
jgi:hypothetical protein